MAHTPTSSTMEMNVSCFMLVSLVDSGPYCNGNADWFRNDPCGLFWVARTPKSSSARKAVAYPAFAARVGRLVGYPRGVIWFATDQSVLSELRPSYRQI